MVKKLYDAKIPIVSGTDSLAGLFLHHEIALYVKAGIPTADALRIASLGAARVMKLDAKTGSIAANKVADFFLVDGDPLAQIEDLRRVQTTVRGGIVFASTPLYETVGVKPL
jgi:imidazolonepropionase-like amidohydrolase